MSKFNISKIMPSKENVADLLNDLNDNSQLCIMCEKLKATKINNTLCQICWNEAEVFDEE